MPSVSLPCRSALRAPLLTLLLGALALSLVAPALAQDSENIGPGGDRIVDGIAAVVGEDILLRSEIDAQVQALVQQRQQPYSDALWMDVLSRRINEKVLAAHARRDTTINVSPAQVEQVLDQRIQAAVQQAGSEEQLEEAYGMSIAELKAEFKEDLREQLLANQFRQRRLNKVRITPTEVRQWFNEIPTDSLPTFPKSVRLAHIVRYPEPSERARRQAREVISSIRDSVLAGVPLEDLARRYSDDSGSAPSGGRISDIALGQLEPEFAAVVSRLPIGEISEVFQTSYGYHIARVNERTGNTVDFNHVLISVDQSTADPSEAIAHLNAVRDSLVGRDFPDSDISFAVMARRHSQEKRSANQGGRVEDPRSGERVLRYEALGPSWKKTLDTLQEGQISEPAEVQLLDGERAYHIVKLIERIPEHRLNLEDDYDRIKQLALRDKQQRVFRDWISELREDLYVDVRANKGDLATAAR